MEKLNSNFLIVHTKLSYFAMLLLLLPWLITVAKSSIIVASESNSNARLESYHFMGRPISLEKLKDFAARRKFMFRNGWWTKSSEPSFTQVCAVESPEVRKYTELYSCGYQTPAIRGEFYYWKPQAGELSQFDPLEMCTIMNGGTLLYVGDSLTEQMFFSTVSTAYYRDIRVGNHKSPVSGSDMCSNLCVFNSDKYKMGLCGHPLPVYCGPNLPPYRIAYEYSEHLDEWNPLWKPTEILYGNRRKRPSAKWLTRVKEVHNASVIVLSTGTHYQNNSQLLYNIEGTLKTLRNDFPDVTLLFKSATVGHPECDFSIAEEPWERPNGHNLKALDLSYPGYHWVDIFNQMEVVEAFLEEQFPDVSFIDVTTTQMQRIDSHVGHTNLDYPFQMDCLHYCMPGPVDSWFHFLFDVLKVGVGLTTHDVEAAFPPADTSVTFFLGENAVDTVAEVIAKIPNRRIVRAWRTMIMTYFLILDGYKYFVPREHIVTMMLLINTTQEEMLDVNRVVVDRIPTKTLDFHLPVRNGYEENWDWGTCVPGTHTPC